MMQTFDFLLTIWKSEKLKNRLIANIKEKNEKEITIDVHTLLFDFEKQIVKVLCNDKNYIFYNKIVPVQIPFDSLVNMINRQFDNIEYEIID